jgi:BASS family bile acid:Na+ symporter
MHAAVHVGLPLLIVLTMTVVGLELTLADLRRVLHYPTHVAVALLGQVLLLPLVAMALVMLLRPEAAIAGGLILAAAAPQAISSSLFCLLARADVALSVTMTAVSSALAVVSTPLIAGLGFALLLDGGSSAFTLPTGEVVRQVVTGLLLPVSAGMLVRHHAPRFATRNRRRFQWLSLAALVLMLAILIVHQAQNLRQHAASIVVVAVLFMVSAAGLAFLLARAFSWNHDETAAMVAGFPSRSLSLVTLIAVNVLERPDFLAFAVTFFLVQSLLLVPLMMLLRPASAPT